MIYLFALYSDTDKHHQKNPEMTYFSFYDEENKTVWKGSISDEQLFEAIKKLLTPEKED